MPRAPKTCGFQSGSNSGTVKFQKCLRPAIKAGRCKEHQPIPYDGAKQRWIAARPKNWNSLRRRVIREADGLCEVCGSPGGEVDHRQPVSAGGSWDRSNLWLLCKPHHDQKSREDRLKYRQRF